MFDTVLIANRGEIALRVIRTLDRLGIASVAIYTPADRDALHVREATVAMPVPSYLDIEAIIAAATGGPHPAQALHPGYGFLSENPALAAACERAGIAFAGPPRSVLAAMGDKLAAKALARDAGLPVVDALSADEARAAGAEAYPLLVKAAAGGGGRGMRVVSAPAELDAALRSAAREARAAFGDPRVFVERFLPQARHLEVQIVADVHGEVLWLGERECSLQRRHQKVIEEAPSPAVSPALRDTLGAEATALARAAGYVGAGTVEFIADRDHPSHHYFLEVNARLQVEHPVTELVHGVDLVALQLLVAAGMPLPLAQDDVVARGHAIEARVCAEDADRGFLPAAGRVLAYDRPAGEGVRVDDWIAPGTVVTTEHDSLLAKVIAHGADRAQALARLQRALSRTTILGLTTTTAYLRGLVADEEVRAGRTDTGLIERRAVPAAPMDDAGVATAAAMLTLADRAADAGRGSDGEHVGGDGRGARVGGDPFDRIDGWRLSGARARSHWRLAVGAGEPVEVDVPAEWVAMVHALGGGRYAIDGRGSWRMVRDGDTMWIGHGGWAWPVRAVSAARSAGGASDGEVRAPMPGQVLRVATAIGDAVCAGDPVVVLESMKMELTLSAPIDGVVAALAVACGDAVVLDQPLARVEAAS